MTLAVKIGDDNSPVRGLMYFDVVTSFSETRQGSVTAFPLDAGVSIADHYIAKNPTFQVKGILSAVDITGVSSTVKVDGSAPINSKARPESPLIVDFSMGITKLLPGSINQFFKTSIPSVIAVGGITPTEDKVKEVLRELMTGVYFNSATKRYQNKMTPITLYEMDGGNIKSSHTDLVLTNFSIDEDAESGDSNIPLTLTFEKVRFVAVEKTAGTNKAKQPKKVAKNVKKGVKTPTVKDCVAANVPAVAKTISTAAVSATKSVVFVKDPKAGPLGSSFPSRLAPKGK